MNIQDRFLKYVSFDTQSDSRSSSTPSSMKQLELAKYLAKEMETVGIENITLNESGIVYGMIPSNNDHIGPVIGFIAVSYTHLTLPTTERV